MNKSISIIIPAYNEVRFIESCLDSIAAQTVMPDEVILVDNNSRDETVNIAERYGFVRVVRETKQGIVHARNAGFNTASSDIIGRIDADTILPVDWVAQVRHFYSVEANSSKALTGGCYFYNLRLARFNGWLQGMLVYRLNRSITGFYPLFGSNMAVPRSSWLSVRDATCQRLDIHEDLDLAIHLHDAGYHIHFQDSLRVGVYLKRVYGHRNQLNKHLRRWPLTYQSHHYDRWWFSRVGNIFLRLMSMPAVAWLYRRYDWDKSDRSHL